MPAFNVNFKDHELLFIEKDGQVLSSLYAGCHFSPDMSNIQLLDSQVLARQLAKMTGSKVRTLQMSVLDYWPSLPIKALNGAEGAIRLLNNKDYQVRWAGHHHWMGLGNTGMTPEIVKVCEQLTRLSND